MKALELDLKYTKAWLNFGTVGGGRVRGLQYSAKDCYMKALELDPEYAGAWYNLGTVGGGGFALFHYFFSKGKNINNASSIA